MENTLTDEVVVLDLCSGTAAEHPVVLADGTVQNLAGLARHELLGLQYEQERDFARRILAAPKGSAVRAQAMGQAYDTVTQIFAAAQGNLGVAPIMGMHPRHERFVLDLLRRQQQRGMKVRFFEIGFGAGKLLKRVCDAGFAFDGIEVSGAMREKAAELLGPQYQSSLYVGDFLHDDAPMADGPWSLVYWNDVFEHIPPDEIGDWLQRVHRMLMSGGQLVTITPNWHVRPSDVTAVAYPPRTEAVGLHLKEYTLGEVSRMLATAGFEYVATPLVVTSGQVVLRGRGLIGAKRWFEPALEWLPFSLARLLCRGFGLSCTIATKQ